MEVRASVSSSGSERSGSPEGADDWSSWIGRTETATETIATERVAALAAMLDWDEAPGKGAALPPGWHWLFFNPAVRRRELGTDGHPKRGGFLPPITLPRRMWAGGRLTYHAPLIVGAEASRRSEIVKIESKSGKSGSLTFVTVRHALSMDGQLCVEEQQDIVYRSPSPPGRLAAGEATPTRVDVSQEINPDTTLLFRYSALTFNGHRIHYDQTYALEQEGYPDLVVHGPLTATLLQGLAASAQPGRRLVKFSFCGVKPLFVDRRFWIEAAAKPEGDGELTMWARDQEGHLAMQASAQIADG